MVTDELKENIRRHYGSSDEDLADLAAVMDALEGMDKVEALKTQLETATLEADRKLKELDDSWRTRYRERFFDGDVAVPDVVDSEEKEDAPEDITIEEYINSISKRKDGK